MAFRLVGGQWPDRWAPRGAGGFNQEPFSDWWPRVVDELGHLDPRVAEQWIHRHWSQSPYFGMDVRRLTSETRLLPTAAFFSDVGHVNRRRGDERAEDPEDVFQTFDPPGRPFEPALTMNAQGSWNIPVLLLESQDGFAYLDELCVGYRLWLIDGHKRIRYLGALASRGRASEVHEAIVLRAA